jgi:hypothetical protein
VPTYAWADLRLLTDFDLPELPAETAADSAEEWRLRRRDGRAALRQPRQWFHRWRQPDGRRWLSFARFPGGYLLRFRNLAEFEIRPQLREIDGYRLPSTLDHTFNHLLLDQVLPLASGGSRRLTLHASVVDVGGRAIAFLGGTRHGKSTLAAALARRGHAVLSDDCCVICRNDDGLAIAPAYPGLRLFPEDIDGLFGDASARRPRVAHYSTKQRVVPREPSRSPLRRVALGALYMLAPQPPGTTPAVTRISARSSRDAVLDIIGVTFCLDVRDADRAREGFTLAAETASVCPVRLLSFPWDLTALDSVVDAVIADR